MSPALRAIPGKRRLGRYVAPYVIGHLAEGGRAHLILDGQLMAAAGEKPVAEPELLRGYGEAKPRAAPEREGSAPAAPKPGQRRAEGEVDAHDPEGEPSNLTQHAEIPGAPHGGSGRDIGPLGTTARVIVGVSMLGSVLYGHVRGPVRPAPWALGLLGFPALLFAWQWWRARRSPGRFEATGPVAQVLNIAVFAALYFTPDYASVLSATSDAALTFYGVSMLLAALRGYAGCEVLAISNWLLRRDDQVGCLLFGPVDYLERRASRHPDPVQRRWSC